MRPSILLLLLAIFMLTSETKRNGPDLTKKEDLKALGYGKIIEKDQTQITKIMLEEVNEVAVVYIKDESMHDIAIDKIARIEFNKTKWGPIHITFPNEKPKIILLN